jgi:transcriptional regulator with XRE-family HTH domain
MGRGISEARNRLTEHRARLREAGLSKVEIKRVTDPMEPFHLQLQEEVESYERLKRGEFEELENLRGFGHLSISLRIAQGMSQRELAKRLNVHESQVSRDERNEYFGVTLERAIRILDVLDVRLHPRPRRLRRVLGALRAPRQARRPIVPGAGSSQLQDVACNGSLADPSSELGDG